MNIAKFLRPSYWGNRLNFNLDEYLDALSDPILDDKILGVYPGFFCIEDVRSF